MSDTKPQCPSCNSLAVLKNGKTRHGRQNHKWRNCGRQFVENPKWTRVSERTQSIQEVIDQMLFDWHFIHHYNASLPIALSFPL